MTDAPLPFVGIQADPASRATRQVMEPFIELFYRERAIRQAMEQFVSEDYVQHNPGIADGRDAAVAALEQSLSRSDLHLDVLRILTDGPYAMIHLHAWREGEFGGSVMDLYRVDSGRIVEHWDVIQQVPQTAANDHPLF